MGTKTDKYDRKNKIKESQEARMQKLRKSKYAVSGINVIGRK